MLIHIPNNVLTQFVLHSFINDVLNVVGFVASPNVLLTFFGSIYAIINMVHTIEQTTRRIVFLIYASLLI